MADLKERIERYRAAGLKGVEFQISHQLPDGGYIWDGYANDAYHKQAYSWGMAGRFGAAHRLLNWVKRTTLLPNGDLEHYRGDVYKLSWFFQGAHRLGRFDLSYPVFKFLLSCQAPCGGFPHFAADKVCRSLATAWTGVSAIYMGRMDVAEKVADWCIKLLGSQPEPDTRFYCQTTMDGVLLTDQNEPKGQCIDTAKLKQPYWEAALPMMLMCRMHQVTGGKSYLDYATRFFEFLLDRCNPEDNFSYVGSGKSSLASAIYYQLTDDERARDAACRFCDFLVETQAPEGGWRDETEPDTILIYIDHAAEFNVWLGEISAILTSKL